MNSAVERKRSSVCPNILFRERCMPLATNTLGSTKTAIVPIATNAKAPI